MDITEKLIRNSALTFMFKIILYIFNKKTDMSISKLVVTTVSYLVGSLSSGKGIQNAKDEFTEALWNWIKPIFIKDDESIIDLKNKPDDHLNQSQVALKIEKFIQKNPSKKEGLKKILENLENKKLPKADIQVSQIHYGSGDNIAGNKIINKNV